MTYVNANLAEHPLDGLTNLPERSLTRYFWKRIDWGFALTKQKRDLRNLSSHTLRDIGVTSSQAHLEANRMAWDVPKNWRC